MATYLEGPLTTRIRGKIGDKVVFGEWKNTLWIRSYVIPSNPRTNKQVNLRTAWRIAVEKYQTLSNSDKNKYDSKVSDLYASGEIPKLVSGFNLFMSEAISAYISQLGVTTTPSSLSLSGSAPDYTFSWS